jgi:tRNA-binding EMAP/Myf-like protein
MLATSCDHACMPENGPQYQNCPHLLFGQPANSKTLPAVAGLKGHVPAEQLQGSCAVAILNLKPARLAGMASEAMLLAADALKEDGTELVRVLVPPGPSSFLSVCLSDAWQVCFGSVYYRVTTCKIISTIAYLSLASSQ